MLRFGTEHQRKCDGRRCDASAGAAATPPDHQQHCILTGLLERKSDSSELVKIIQITARPRKSGRRLRYHGNRFLAGGRNIAEVRSSGRTSGTDDEMVR